MRRVVFALLCAVLAGCAKSEFRCESDEQCVDRGSRGWCEAAGYCSFPDPSCASSGRSYAPHSGELSETCVEGFALTVHNSGGGGRVVSSPDGIDCGERCSAVFGADTRVVLGAVREDLSYVSWTGDCKGTATDCAPVMDKPRDVTATFRTANYAFVTSTRKRAGEWGGLLAADDVCNNLAQSAGLPGSYVAWLSTSSQNAIDRIAVARRWMRPDGKPVADSVNDIRRGRLFYPVRLDETGADVGGTMVATGTQLDGTSSGMTANDWTSPSLAASAGFADAGLSSWTEGINAAPTDAVPIYCFGIELQDTMVELAIEKTDARVAFVTPAAAIDGTGIGWADTRCAQVAGDLPGPYRALVALTDKSAADRFSDGRPWARADGIIVAASREDLAAGKLLAPITTSADGVTYNNAAVWTGARTPGEVATAASNCANWTTTTGMTTMGRSSRSTNAFFFPPSTSPGSCMSVNARLYCLQD